MRFTDPLFAACVGQVIYVCVCVCMCIFVCDWVCVLVRVSLSRRERRKDKGGRMEQCSAGVGRVVGWQMPEGFIRLEGRRREQFSWKSIRPKHKHRRASNPGLALQSLSHGFSFFSVALSFPHSYPPVFTSPPLPEFSNAISPSSSSSCSSLVQHVALCFLLSFLKFLFVFLSVFLVFLLLPCLSVKRSSH